MFVIVVYDVHHKRVSKVRKVFNKYLHSVQRSAFEGNITEAKLKKLKKELSKIIDVNYDSICLYKLISTKYTSKEQIGIVKHTINII
ncbi:CRISPR-associated endonuclease Cas2 [Thomasclavelia spiroformis]|uniref:CRISPR-associated endonuclease Cas2 n=1 Tax=Thomasclavelia spiroformis TaxID=29348 RepID=UPI00320AF37A